MEAGRGPQGPRREWGKRSSRAAGVSASGSSLTVLAPEVFVQDGDPLWMKYVPWGSSLLFPPKSVTAQSPLPPALSSFMPSSVAESVWVDNSPTS